LTSGTILRPNFSYSCFTRNFRGNFRLRNHLLGFSIIFDRTTTKLYLFCIFASLVVRCRDNLDDWTIGPPHERAQVLHAPNQYSQDEAQQAGIVRPSGNRNMSWNVRVKRCLRCLSTRRRFCCVCEDPTPYSIRVLPKSA
jgi:hypothetical protein